MDIVNELTNYVLADSTTLYLNTSNYYPSVVVDPKTGTMSVSFALECVIEQRYHETEMMHAYTRPFLLPEIPLAKVHLAIQIAEDTHPSDSFAIIWFQFLIKSLPLKESK